MSRAQRRLERWAALLAVAGGLPGVAVAVLVAAWAGLSAKTIATIAIVCGGSLLVAALVLRGAIVRALRTIANLVASLREGDYSVRGRHGRRDHALGEVHAEVNALADTLRSERLEEIEASALLARLLDEIDVAVLAFDDAGLLRLANRVAERLLHSPATEMLGRPAAALGLCEVLDGEAPRILDRTFPGGGGRFELRRAPFRRAGVAHVLVTLADVSRALRDEERAAWRRLVRVLSHEIINSTAPIQSVAAGLLDALARSPETVDADAVRSSAELIARRAESLSRFIAAYAQLARLPPPVLRPVSVEGLVRRAAALEQRTRVVIDAGPAAEVLADGDQIEQALINLVHNAVDAVKGDGAVTAGWRCDEEGVLLFVWDDGPGIADTANLFVPFFTTKPGGSGIGLALSRQIAEAHGGRLTLANRAAGGCAAQLWLPRARPARRADALG